MPTEAVLAEDIQSMLYRRDSVLLKHLVGISELIYEDTIRVHAFCDDERFPRDRCLGALAPDRLKARRKRDSTFRFVQGRQYLRMWWPFWGRSRATVNSYLRRSGLDDGLNFSSQFSAMFREKEAYVGANIVRGVVGTYLFSADYGAVVAKADTADTLTRKAIESHTANTIRSIVNGGTIVGHLTVPLYAGAGGSWARAVGLSVGAGFLGPIKEDPVDKQRFTHSLVGEWVNVFALRSSDGSYGDTSDLLLGVRGGYTQAEKAIKTGGHDASVHYAQLLFGIRQGNAMAFSALVTLAEGGFSPYVPRLLLTYSAAR